MADQNQMGSDSSPLDPALLVWAEYWYPIAWKGLLVAGLITAVGACAGIAFLLLQWRTSSIRDQQSDWRTSVLEVQAKRADADLAQARADITTADARAAEANARALEAQLALERFKAPRSLSNEQLVKIAGKLRQFAGQEYAITTFWDLKEPLALSNQIHQALTIAEWKYIPPGTGGAFLLGGIAGVQVWVHPTADASVKTAADALIGTLNAEQIEAELKLQNPANPKDNRIGLNIGTKP